MALDNQPDELTTSDDGDSTWIEHIQRKVELAAQMAQNELAETALGQLGVKIEQTGAIAFRAALLVETLLGDMDSPDRLAFELTYQQWYARQLVAIADQVPKAQAQVASQQARSRLLEGVPLRTALPAAPPNGDLRR